MNNYVRATLFFVALFSVSIAAAQTSRSWKNWSKKDAEKILNDSAWSHLQIETNTSEMFYQPTSDPRLSRRTAPNSGARLEEGAVNQEVSVKYGIRFFSARPVRRAFVRLMQLQERQQDPAVIERMDAFADLEPSSSIIVAVTSEATDSRAQARVMQAFASAVTGTLKNTTYLERSDGRRLFLDEYVPPGRDGFGARFIFRRRVDNMTFINVDSGEIRFYSEYAPGLKLNMRFKAADMMSDGRLEY